MRGRPLAAGAVALGLAASLSLSACGVPVTSSPQVLSAGIMPKALSATIPTIPPPKTLRGKPVLIYLLNPVQRLFAVPRTVGRVTAQSVLDVLEQGPSSKEFAEGLTTELLPGSRLVVLGVVKGIAQVQLDSDFLELIGEAAVLELAQVVDTLANVQALKITAVQFYFDGVPTEAEIGNGSLVTRPVTARDYASLVAQV